MTDSATALNELQARPLAEQAVRSLAEQTAEIASERAGHAAAKAAVESVFLHLGIDILDKEQVSDLRESLQYLKRLNRGAKEVKSVAIKTCVGAVVTGIITLLVLGLKDWIFKVG